MTHFYLFLSRACLNQFVLIVVHVDTMEMQSKTFISLIQEHVSSPKQIQNIYFQQHSSANPYHLANLSKHSSYITNTTLLNRAQTVIFPFYSIPNFFLIHVTKSWTLRGLRERTHVPLLLYTKLLSQHHNKAMDLVGVCKRRRHALPFHAPLGPSDQLGALRLYAEVAKGLVCIKPAREGHQSHIYKPNFFTTEVRLLSKLSFQKLKALYEFLLGCFLLFSFG